ncbi:MAG: 2Fe-2S iron-sulfur cluster binding domain-containing protein [Hellea sp.]|nr:2Fe-2S iron-sulfur cluster binding domain-containing protein [Hellea sp.]
MATFKVTTQGGETKDVEAPDGTILMQALNNALLVEATCGGAASCGTCHVYFEDASLAGERTEDEGYMLESLEDFVEIKDGSRLCCQMTVEARHDGCAIEIAPEA